MGRPASNLAGQIFGRLTVMSRDGIDAGGNSVFLCLCSCGKTHRASAHCLKRGSVRSCGCLAAEETRARKTIHGHTKRSAISGEWHSWRALRRRCEDPDVPNYKRYGGRGISVCDQWATFENFLADMGHKPSPRHSIDRIDNDGNYEPGNCRWATPNEQARNRPSTRLTLDRASEIKRRRNAGGTLEAVADDFNVSVRHVRDIEAGRRWKDAA